MRKTILRIYTTPTPPPPTQTMLLLDQRTTIISVTVVHSNNVLIQFSLTLYNHYYISRNHQKIHLQILLFFLSSMYSIIYVNRNHLSIKYWFTIIHFTASHHILWNRTSLQELTILPSCSHDCAASHSLRMQVRIILNS